MKTRGISDEGFSRLVRSLKGQEGFGYRPSDDLSEEALSKLIILNQKISDLYEEFDNFRDEDVEPFGSVRNVISSTMESIRGASTMLTSFLPE